MESDEDIFTSGSEVNSGPLNPFPMVVYLLSHCKRLGGKQSLSPPYKPKKLDAFVHDGRDGSWV